MNPYLEQEDLWQDFHDSMIPAIRDAVAPQVRPEYIVKIEQQIFIHEPDANELIFFGKGDVGLTRRQVRIRTGSTALAMTAPARIRIPSIEFEKHPFLEIRDRKNRELVTVLELLSPTNKKNGPDREQYLAKRGKLLRGNVHFIEIDLLRGWPRMPMEPESACDYCIMVSRAEERPEASFWPLKLRDRLPNLPVPLRDPSPDAHIDLQEILHGVYDRAGYADHVYEGTPTPRLSRKDASWARSLL